LPDFIQHVNLFFPFDLWLVFAHSFGFRTLT
jgi:hypothetical protein